jgi:DnaJ-class molecular chaperone
MNERPRYMISGAPRLSGGGERDVLARLRIEVPKRLNNKQCEPIQELRKATS